MKKDKPVTVDLTCPACGTVTKRTLTYIRALSKVVRCPACMRRMVVRLHRRNLDQVSK